jgi:ABC-type transport system involved in multi-copper enzyme maturation permease subunit
MWEAAMKQYKALIIKEWHTHRNTFLVPSYVLAVFLLLSTLVSVFARIRYGAPTINLNVSGSFGAMLVLRNLHYLMSVVLGWFVIVISLQLNDNLLNHDFQKKCEIMHGSQPVSMVKVLAAKFTFSVPMMMGQYLILAILSSLILSAVVAFLGFNSWIMGLKAMLSPALLVFVSMMVLSSVMWLFSSVFRKKAFLNLYVTLIVIESLRMILIHLWGVSNVFSPLRYYIQAFTMPFSILNIQSTQVSLVMESVFSQQNLIRLGVSILMYIAGYFIYRRRELS